ncbi:hypothetical protein [Microbacterium sp. BK668]|uniref:hypothetical protein n=1 Tax=Microbacterium sp. BK668 TaxID=2512118 RepID=UPI00106149CB|nr:hypothetical protein [Microbacterium sp. BK668]TDN87732.1 hypothetical protein EV279_3160 [Microbacterium sp. BK668]
MIFQAIVAVFFASWFALTLYKNLPAAWRRLPLLNAVSGSWLVPSWAFFAPTPGTKRYHLIYRDYGVDEVSKWKNVEFSSSPGLRRAIWNPEKTVNKALVDLANEMNTIVASLAEEDRSAPPDRIQLSTPYLTLLAFVSSIPRLHLAVATQFALGQTGEEESTVLLISAVHRLSPAEERAQ